MGIFSNLFGNSNLIYIHTDKQKYYAGEVVTGQVILCVIQPLQMNGVFIKLSGLEQTKIEVQRSKHVPDPKPENPQNTRIVFWNEEVNDANTFFRRKYCIFAQSCVLNPGNFVFPFQFPLEAKLPGTFKLQTTHSSVQGVDASVLYQVEAEVAVPGMFNPNLRHSQQILIHEPLRAALMASDTYKETKVTWMCCVPKGTVSLSASLEKNAYCPGEVVRLRLIVDNSKSTVDLPACSLKLTGAITVRARGETKRMGGTIVKATSPGLPAGERAERMIEMILPHSIEPSTSSKLVHCAYTVDAVLKVPWSPDVLCKTCVQIVIPQTADYVAQLQYPPGWNPTVYSPVDLQKMQYTTY